MTPMERLQAAIDKLERLKAERGYVEVNGWLAEPVTGDTARSWLEPRDDLSPITNDELVVMLHRTIDAQLGVLHSSIEWFEKAEAEWSDPMWVKHPALRDALRSLLRQELALADVVLGDGEHA